MNKRSKKAWLENVAWGLVVSMSVLQLTSGWQWGTAQAGQFECWTTLLQPKKDTVCGGCSEAGCPGDWSDVSSYEYCEKVKKGQWKCDERAGWWNIKEIGKTGDCIEQYSYIKIALCAGTGVGAGVVLGCGALCAPTLPSGPGYILCMSGCLGLAGGGGFALCCSTSCFCITRCVRGVGTPINKPLVDLTRPGCGSNNDEGG